MQRQPTTVDSLNIGGGSSAPGELKRLGEFSLHDLESVSLMLRGSSVVDWHRLHFESRAEARRFLDNHGFSQDNPEDTKYLESVQQQAVRHLRRTFEFKTPQDVAEMSLIDLMMLATGPSGHRQKSSCTVLKVMQVIHHMAGRELLFRLPVSDRDLFHLVEEKVYRVVGTMLGQGFPITEFVGGRKNLDSTYTKLLSKPESTASAIYDKLRFRIVTERQEDLLPVLLYLSERVFPFNYVVPSQSTNTIINFDEACEADPHLRVLARHLQGRSGDQGLANDNRYSARDYRTIQIVTDVPIRVPPHLLELAPEGSESLGKVVYMLCELQLLDAQTEAANETGSANHEAYKRRQREAVLNRLYVDSGSDSDGKG